VVRSNLGLKEKIRLIDALQYWVYPALGVITFALDYVTDREVVLRLYDNVPAIEMNANNRIFDEGT